MVRAELRLARPSSEPLAHLPLNPDPLQTFAAVIARVRPTNGEQAQVAVDLLPAAPAARRRLRRRVLDEARRRSDVAASGPYTGGLVGYIIGSRQQATRTPAEVIAVRAEREQIATKLLQAEPLFRMQVLIRCSSPQRGRAVECLQGLLGCFDGFAAANISASRASGSWESASPGRTCPGRRRGSDRRMKDRPISSLPQRPCQRPGVNEAGRAVYPAPKSLPTFTGQRSLIPLGRVQDERGERRVGLRLQDSFFTYTAGRSRWGKTELALTQFLHLVRSGHGGLFLDPHEDAIAKD